MGWARMAQRWTAPGALSPGGWRSRKQGKALGRVEVPQDRIVQGDFGDGFGVLGEELARAGVAGERHHGRDVAAVPQDRVTPLGVMGWDDDEAALVRVIGADQAVYGGTGDQG